MSAKKAGRGLRSETAAPLSSGSTRKGTPSLCAYRSTSRRDSSVSASPKAKFAARSAFAFAALSGLLLVIAAAGLAVEYLAGIGGLAVFAALFVVCLMVLAREEGL